jgi:hypothetical protein
MSPTESWRVWVPLRKGRRVGCRTRTPRGYRVPTGPSCFWRTIRRPVGAQVVLGYVASPTAGVSATLPLKEIQPGVRAAAPDSAPSGAQVVVTTQDC